MNISRTGLSHELHGAKPLTITVAMAQKLSGLGNTTLWALIKTRKLETIHVGRRRLIVYRSLEELLSPAPDSSPQPRRRGRPPKRQWADHHRQKAPSDRIAPGKEVNNSREVVT